MINLSNHPSAKWSASQRNAARLVDGFELVDIAFPNVDPSLDEIGVEFLAISFVEKITEMRRSVPHRVVHLMGESSFVAVLSQMLAACDIACCVSTTERKSVEAIQPDGTTKKEVVFSFVQFRRLPRAWIAWHGTGDEIASPHFLLPSNEKKFTDLRFENRNL